MDKKVLLDFDPIAPIHVISSMTARELFGKMYKYDLPKWCAQKNMHCFYYPPTCVYLIFPNDLCAQ